jgi:hypothetical protein
MKPTAAIIALYLLNYKYKNAVLSTWYDLVAGAIKLYQYTKAQILGI